MLQFLILIETIKNKNKQDNLILNSLFFLFFIIFQLKLKILTIFLSITIFWLTFFFYFFDLILTIFVKKFKKVKNKLPKLTLSIY